VINWICVSAARHHMHPSKICNWFKIWIKLMLWFRCNVMFLTGASSTNHVAWQIFGHIQSWIMSGRCFWQWRASMVTSGRTWMRSMMTWTMIVPVGNDTDLMIRRFMSFLWWSLLWLPLLPQIPVITSVMWSRVVVPESFLSSWMVVVIDAVIIVVVVIIVRMIVAIAIIFETLIVRVVVVLSLLMLLIQRWTSS